MNTSTPTSTARPRLTLSDFKVPLLLVLLSLVPAIGGIVRLSNISGDVPVTEENARFVAAPLPILVHIIAVTLYSLLGAFQFSARLRARWPGWHRYAGRVLVLCGLVGGFTGLYMTHFYAIPQYHQGVLTYWVRLLVGSAMVVSIVVAIVAIVRRQVARHEDFMIRAYALGQGAGTQVLMLGPWMLITGESEGFTRDVLLTLSWAINAVLAELIIASRRRRNRERADRAAALRSSHLPAVQPTSQAVVGGAS